MSRYNLDIVSPLDTVYTGQVEFITVPGTEGQLGILARHASLLTSLTAGKVRIFEKKDTLSRQIDIQGGFMEITDQGVILLVKVK